MVTLKSFLGMIAAVPFIMACNQTGQVNATLFPASGSENVNPDTHLVLTCVSFVRPSIVMRLILF